MAADMGDRSAPAARRSSFKASPACVGDVVLIGQRRVEGVVRYVGTAEFASGEWLGVELCEPLGKNDGSINGRRYFSCQPLRGIFIRPNALKSRTFDGAFEAPSVDLDTDPRRRSSMTTLPPQDHVVSTPPVQKFNPMTSSPPSTYASFRGSPQSQEGSASCASPADWSSAGPGHSEMSGRASSPRLAEAQRAARRGLAEAVEEHDVEGLRRALSAAKEAGLSGAELEGAKRILDFEMQRSLCNDLAVARSQVSQLQAQVMAAEQRAAEAARRAEEAERHRAERQMMAPQEIDLETAWSRGWLDKVAEKVEDRIWSKLERRLGFFAESMMKETNSKLETTLSDFRAAIRELDDMLAEERKAAASHHAMSRSLPIVPENYLSQCKANNLAPPKGPEGRRFSGTSAGTSAVSAEDSDGEIRYVLAMAMKETENRSPPLTPGTSRTRASDTINEELRGAIW